MTNERIPMLIIVSAPSGAGKTTLCDRLLEDRSDVVYSISCTSREPRGTEVDGEDYFFLTREGFKERIAEGMFLEYAEVHGHLYGTLLDTVNESLNEGAHVLLDIDVQGARIIRRSIDGLPADDPLKNAFLDIFIMPPSIDVLAQRLRDRAEDDDDQIERRLAAAQEEMSHADDYMYRVINDVFDQAYREFYDIIEMEEKKRTAV